ncbi:cytochrome P450 [Diaporthe sp. PMI_573]|nr:cytochrome P450 [Diaporthaceae sp. PMI_573]
MQRRTDFQGPPRLGETIPFVSNTWQFMTNKRVFISRVREALRTSPVVQCRLGPMKLNLVTGSSNVSAIFRASFSSEPWVIRILQHSAGYTPKDVAKFIGDETGAASKPRNGSTTDSSPEQRIWRAMHRMYDESLVSTHPVKVFSRHFQRFFALQLAKFQAGKWSENVQLYDLLRQDMATAATHAVMGKRILEVNPGFVDAFWEYEQVVEALAFGLPSWMNQKGIRVRDRFRAMCIKWYETADREFDWDNKVAIADRDWEPVFGARISRELGQWAKSFDFSAESVGAAYCLFLFGLHANTIPVCTWVLMEIFRDPKLFQAIKEEVRRAKIADGPDAGSLDHQVLCSLPLLQSVLTECLRLHVGVLITRTSTDPVNISGYSFPIGSVFQAPTEVAHLDEAVWGAPDHPASEFWAHRHIKEIEKKDGTGKTIKSLEFSIAGRAGFFFPYGGGSGICAGRNLAKPEVLLVVAMFVLNFDVEFTGWVKADGTSSNRPAMNDTKYANAVAAPPDRDMMIRLRRVQ